MIPLSKEAEFMKKLSAIRVLTIHGEADALRIYPEFMNFIISLRGKVLREESQRMIKEYCEHKSASQGE